MNENALMESVIRAEGLGKTYAEGKMHTPVFDGLDLNVAAGETVEAASSLALNYGRRSTTGVDVRI